MLNKLQVVVIVFSLVAVGILTSSCKHDSPEEAPQTVEPGVDGIAVRGMPEMDARFAERVLREGPVGATADITQQEESEGSSAPEALVPAEAESTAPSSPSRPSETYDPNF